jgi:hypothetical protein
MEFTTAVCTACLAEFDEPLADSAGDTHLCPACNGHEIDGTEPSVPPTYRHVNAYEVGRCYGGPEEGGWWYDAGTPLGSIMVENIPENIEAGKTLLRAVFGPGYEGNRDRHSAAGEENLEIYVEDHVARPFPASRPRYE